MASTRVVLEVAPRRAFASALDWPGWSRGAKTAEAAIEALMAYAPRYAEVARRARLDFDPGPPEVVEELPGSSGTEFGVPGAAAAAEEAPVGEDELERLVALLSAAWATFDASASAAAGVELTKGPRGGGRDTAKIVDHVAEADAAYVGQLGSRPPHDEGKRPERRMAALRDAFLAALRARVRGEPLPNPRNTKRPWSPRYAVRRSAWHALDHAWEIEDRTPGA